MSLIQYSPTGTTAPKVIQPIAPVNAHPVIVDNQVKPLSNLRNYIEGMQCVVHYYSQVGDQNAATYGHDVGKSPLLQQYKKINRLIIRLDGDISEQQNTQDKSFTAVGTAFVTNGVVPNEGDMFSMDAGNGRVAIMQVNNSQRMTAVDDSVYQIDFTRMYYATDARYADLEKKVIQTYEYLKDFANFGKEAVVTQTEFADLKALSTIQYELVDDYLRNYANRDSKLLVVPGQFIPTHDAFTAHAFRSLVNVRRHPSIENLRFVKDGVTNTSEQPTLWDVLMERRKELLVGCRSQSHALMASAFPQRPILRSMRFCGADQLVFPALPGSNPDNLFVGSTPWAPEAVAPVAGPAAMLARKGAPNPAAATMPPLHPVCMDGYYILSSAFYTNDAAQQSLLEKLVWDYLENESISARDVHYLVSNHRAWSAVDRYFYVPIVLVLIQALLLDGN